MTSTPAPEAATDPALIAAVEFARAAARELAGTEVGAHVGVRAEDSASATHLFEADKPGYRGWRWAVTVAVAGGHEPVTLSEAVLLPGPDALVAPPWVPWQDRVRAGDLGVGDLLPTAPDDARLAPAYVGSDDPELEAMATDVGLGRVRVMSRFGRLDTAERWHTGEFGPGADMARSAPAACGTCAFYLPVAGALGAAFGVCGNELAPADGRAVHAAYGCGAHSEAEVEQISPVLVADLIYDDAQLDVEAHEHASAVSTPDVEDVAAESMAEVAEVPEVDEAAAVDAELPAGGFGAVVLADGEADRRLVGAAPAAVIIGVGGAEIEPNPVPAAESAVAEAAVVEPSTEATEDAPAEEPVVASAGSGPWGQPAGEVAGRPESDQRG
ncbi:DUF3027 domain-containing protein [Actinokineospora enzanensis]|uniref:DUF3027 domain-containing protein n=1 Tax=Actinokineospora enzanensis TaxID=155975 RepID=UPI0007C56414|nr:DUF3027 domain-containing protein [Actinokineospora enzanensis]